MGEDDRSPCEPVCIDMCRFAPFFVHGNASVHNREFCALLFIVLIINKLNYN